MPSLRVTDCCKIQGERDDNIESCTPASATLTARASPHHLTETDEHSILTQTSSLEMPAPDGNSNANANAGYEALDARQVEEARIRNQRPSEYAALPRADNLEDPYSRPIKKR